jgi:hypothetical protein
MLYSFVTHLRFRIRLALIVASIPLLALLTGCNLTLAEKEAIGAAGVAVFSGLCPLEGLIPNAGTTLVGECSAEDAAVQAAIAAAIAAETPSARQARLALPIAAQTFTPIYATRTKNVTYKGQTFPVTGKVRVAAIPTSLAPIAQAYLDAHPG